MNRAYLYLLEWRAHGLVYSPTFIKIGVTSNIERRTRTHQSSMAWWQLRAVKVFGSRAEAFDAERVLTQLYAPCRVAGSDEQFYISHEEVEFIVDLPISVFNEGLTEAEVVALRQLPTGERMEHLVHGVWGAKAFHRYVKRGTGLSAIPEVHARGAAITPL